MRTLHGGMGMIMMPARERCRVPRLRQFTRKVVKKCYGCHRHYAKAVQEKHPGLLRSFVRKSSVTIELHFVGPTGYCALLYACSLTRAMYLELMPRLESREFIESFKHFIARKARPSKVYSDNAKRFVSAAKWIGKVHSDEFLKRIR